MNRLGVLVAVLLGGAILLTGMGRVDVAQAAWHSPVPAPEAPAPGYTPHFVTQTDERAPWEDCLWASGVMLLDKWTHGRISPDRVRLRAASGDRVGGSRFPDLVRAIARLYGFHADYSPGGGDNMTWNDLLERLANGGGAAIAGDYWRLGWPYNHWGGSYARDRHAAGHAMYIERYDAARGRIWLMDPLGRGTYRGEWVPVGRIKDFIWKRNGHVYAVATPQPPAASVNGWAAGQLSVDAGAHQLGDMVTVTIPITQSGPWPLPRLDLATTWTPVAPDGSTTADLSATTSTADASAEPSADPSLVPTADPTTSPAASPAALPAQARPESGAFALRAEKLEPNASDRGGVASPVVLRAEVSLPSQPGVWRLATQVELDGKALTAGWQQTVVDLRVWGDRGAVLLPALTAAGVTADTNRTSADAAPTVATLTAGASVPVALLIQNAGRMAWTVGSHYPLIAEQADPTTVLTVTWVGGDGRELPAAEPITLAAASRQQLTVSLLLTAPDLVGRYSLEFDVRDGSGSLLPADAASTSTVNVLVLAPASPSGQF